MKLQVSASDTTRTIVARMYGAAPAYLRWNAEMGSNMGELMVPASLRGGPLQSDGDGGGFRAQHRQWGGGN